MGYKGAKAKGGTEYGAAERKAQGKALRAAANRATRDVHRAAIGRPGAGAHGPGGKPEADASGDWADDCPDCGAPPDRACHVSCGDPDFFSPRD